MSGPVVIAAEHLGKRYTLGERAPYGIFRDRLIAGASAVKRFVREGPAAIRRERETISALDDVSFEVREGEVVGIVGRNGSGKSTLLKILARITEPTTGHATVRGRIGALLEVGAGFHPELTGRENIFVNGSILGMKRRQIVARFDEIVAFAGVEGFLDTPVKRYSSGMLMRLAFAVAAHLDAHILLVDEVLAVGDAEFQRKCLGKMHEVSQAGRTVILVSHQMGQVRRLCRRVIWLDRGRIRASGATEPTIHDYEAASVEGQASGGAFRRWELGDATTRLSSGSGPFTVRLHLDLVRPVTRGQLAIALLGANDEIVVGWAFEPLDLEVSTPYVDLSLPHLPLRPGTYRWMFTLYDDGNNLTGGRVIEHWRATPELAIGGVPVGHPQDVLAGWLNVPATLTVAGRETTAGADSGRLVGGR